MSHSIEASSGDSAIRDLLVRHPFVTGVTESNEAGIQFSVGEWQREVLVGDSSNELYGLVEIMDNNPLVCADRISVPSAGATLALIALAPLTLAGLVADSPALIFNFEVDEEEIEAALNSVGWPDGAAIHSESIDLEGVCALTAMISIKTPEDVDDIDGLFEERFGRSFYVRSDEDSEWSPDLVKGKPYAVFRMHIAVDQPESLLTVRVLADPIGKCGAAQAVHAMNVMCGFEESLGIS